MIGLGDDILNSLPLYTIKNFSCLWVGIGSNAQCMLNVVMPEIGWNACDKLLMMNNSICEFYLPLKSCPI
jgi:hypothetical protein